MEEVENLINWASDVAEKSGYNVTTTEVLAELVLKVRAGKCLEKIKQEVEEEYTSEKIQ